MVEQQAAPRVHTKDRGGDLRGAAGPQGRVLEGHREQGVDQDHRVDRLRSGRAQRAHRVVPRPGGQLRGGPRLERYVTYLTIGYMISRGLAKSGSRYPQDG